MSDAIRRLNMTPAPAPERTEAERDRVGLLAFALRSIDALGESETERAQGRAALHMMLSPSGRFALEQIEIEKGYRVSR